MQKNRMQQLDKLMCPIHNQQTLYICVDKYCKMKDKFICQICLQQKSHNMNHEIEKPAKFVKKLNIQCLYLLKETTKLQNFQNDMQKMFQEAKTQLIESLDSLEDHINNEIDSMILVKSDEQQRNFKLLLQNLKKNTLDQESFKIAHNYYTDTELQKLVEIDSYKLEKEQKFNQYFDQVFNLEKQINLFEKNYISQLLPTQPFEEQFNIEKFQGKARYLKGHKDQIFSIAKLSPTKIVTGGYDEQIIVWNLITQKKIKTLKGHSGYISALVNLGSNLLGSGSGGSDNTIKIWNYKNGKCIQNLKGHTRVVQDLIKLNNYTIASASHDKSIKIWNFITGQTINSLKGHTDWITQIVKLSSFKIASLSHDKTIKIWSWKSGYCEKTLQSQQPSFSSHSLINLGRNLLAATCDNQIMIWNWLKGQCIQTLKNNQLILSMVKIGREELASIQSDNKLRLWNWADNRYIEVQSCQQEVTSLIKINNCSLASGSSDKTIVIWY
ncbi:WD40-repeat-containing domain [Pseudocohnilembus persalinus]|uniref:WD40-repeat-containing domain n=1 Tax=Pseudocohnilembus persalinus TaxID=266149 RepID=A0A0V0QJM6_PSEPJ|nr:WD40-repeat-containing domain [Pseudocohnilembus persalinus]|eukprot:KRX02547.1 WD40-repeat-containing domain [Pseudocohnilembus persalinus]